MAELEAPKPNRVRVALGATIHPLPDDPYTTARIDIAVETDGRPGEKVDDTVERVYKYLDNKLDEKIREALDGN